MSSSSGSAGRHAILHSIRGTLPCQCGPTPVRKDSKSIASLATAETKSCAEVPPVVHSPIATTGYYDNLSLEVEYPNGERETT